MNIPELNSREVDVLLAAREAWLSDLLEPHDTMDCLGWRVADDFGDRYYIHCGDLCNLELMEVGDVRPKLYRITTEGNRVAEAIVARVNQPHRATPFAHEVCPLELLYRQFASGGAE